MGGVLAMGVGDGLDGLRVQSDRVQRYGASLLARVGLRHWAFQIPSGTRKVLARI